MHTKHLREQARARAWFFLRPLSRVHIEIYLYIEGLRGVRKPEYLEQLRFFYPPAGKAHFPWRAEKSMSGLGFVGVWIC